MTELKIPKFATKAEEADWWYDNREIVSAEFQKAAKEGRLRRGGVAHLLAERSIPFPQSQALPTTTIRLDPEDHEALRDAEKTQHSA
jgi:hypothetical protein